MPQAPLAEPLSLLVYRDAEDEVRFIELNAMTAALIEDVQEGQLTARQALIGIASVMALDDLDALIDFGLQVLADLKAQGAILGVEIN